MRCNDPGWPPCLRVEVLISQSWAFVYRDHEVKYVIDAGDIGGVARYINHSCDVRPSICVPNPVHLMHFLPMGGRIVEGFAVTRRPKVLPGSCKDS